MLLWRCRNKTACPYKSVLCPDWVACGNKKKKLFIPFLYSTSKNQFNRSIRLYKWVLKIYWPNKEATPNKNVNFFWSDFGKWVRLGNFQDTLVIYFVSKKKWTEIIKGKIKKKVEKILTNTLILKPVWFYTKAKFERSPQQQSI